MKYYAVSCGRVPGIYTDYEDARKQIEGFPRNQMKSFKTREKAVEYLNWEEVYTDGSCFDNGYQYAKAGYGVWYGHDDPRNTYGPLHGPKRTNNRAKLEAIRKALATKLKENNEKVLVIYTDSKYAINCLTAWHFHWEKNGYINKLGHPVSNQNLIKTCLKLFRKLNANGEVKIEYVKGHSTNEGNNQAHKLANKGARGKSK